MFFRFVYRKTIPFYGALKAAQRGAGRARASARKDALKFPNVEGLAPLLCAGLAGAMLVSACASGPIDMVSADEMRGDVITAQADLRDSAATLAGLVEAEGWRLAPTAGEQARSFLGRLIGGGDEAAGEDDPVGAYLQAAAPGSVSRDLETLQARTRAVARHARTVAAAPDRLSEDSLQIDIAAAEAALGAVRRAHAFFVSAGERLETPPATLAGDLQKLEQAESGLAEAADALAARRWSQAGETLTG